jgi:hypothetical protein
MDVWYLAAARVCWEDCVSLMGGARLGATMQTSLHMRMLMLVYRDWLYVVSCVWL